jgi:RNA polymerase sigma factor (sigma-70 family)
MTVTEYNIIVDNYADGVYRFILKNVKNSDVAKDIIQDTFEKLWIKVEDIEFEKAKSYLFTAAYHTYIDYIRKEKRIVGFEKADRRSMVDETEYKGIQEILDKAVDKLPEQQKAVVMLRDYEGYSYKEIAEITRLSEDQVKVYIYRARIFLKEHLKSVDLFI